MVASTLILVQMVVGDVFNNLECPVLDCLAGEEGAECQEPSRLPCE